MHNGASHGMVFPLIKGGENVCLRGLSPSGLLEFTLLVKPPPLHLTSVPARNRCTGLGHNRYSARRLELDLIWRAACIYEGYAWLPQMKKLQAEVH